MLEKIFNDNNNTSFDEDFKKKIEKENSNFNYSNKNQQYDQILPVDVVLAIKELPLGSSPGPDGITNEMLKHLPANIINQVTNLANKSLRDCYLPSEWKTAQVTMLHKKDDKSDPNNYRPISLTSCLGKLIERIMNKRLYNYIESKNLLAPQQSGFRKARRCADNLLFITQKVREAFNRKKKAMLLTFDIQKAFDKVWHQGVIYKMRKMRIPEYLINWIAAFLRERKYFVKVNDAKSDLKNILNGAPQGSIHSPLIYLIFTNDAPLFLRKFFNYSMLFADDLSTLSIFKKPKNLIKTANIYLDKLSEWLKCWRLKMSAPKCSYTVFSNGPYKDKDSFKLKLSGETIPYNPNPKLLGITLDESLCFNKNSEKIKEKCMSRLNIIKILSHKRWKLSKETLKSLYCSLIGSVIEYSFFTISEISISTLNYLQAIQNQAIRLIYNLDSKTSTHTLNAISNLKPINERFNQLFEKYLNSASQSNPLIKQLIDEYKNSYNSIIKNESYSTPLTYIFRLIDRNTVNATEPIPTK